MNIVINTNYQSAGTKVCVDDLIPRLRQAGHQVSSNDWQNYQAYDLALFMSPDAEPQRAKRQNPRLKTGIMVPMTDYPKLQANARAADFLLVGSLEARDEQLKYNKNIFIYYHFPDLPALKKKHSASPAIRLGYHGNLQHLVTFHPAINHAISRLAKETPLELWAVYNLKKHGQWKNTPRGIRVKHIQWHPQVYRQDLAQCDIGIVNNTIPQGSGIRHLVTQPLTRYLRAQLPPFRAHDTILRFKYATNPGRLYPFAQLNIPIVADFAPSMSQFIHHGHTGLLANSREGWYDALSNLVNSPYLRQTLADNLLAFITEHHSLDQNFARLNDYLIKQQKKS